jgi:hypothetical protein
MYIHEIRKRQPDGDGWMDEMTNRRGLRSPSAFDDADLKGIAAACDSSSSQRVVVGQQAHYIYRRVT